MKRALEDDPKKEVIFGPVVVTRVKDSDHYHLLYDEVEADPDKGFHNNRNWILQAFVEKRLYSARVVETESMYDYTRENEEKHPLFLKRGFWRLPVLCVLAKERRDTVEILWVAKRTRRHGFGSAMMEALGVRYALDILYDSLRFWEKCGVVEVSALKMSFRQITKRDGDDSSSQDGDSCETLSSSSEEEIVMAGESLVNHQIINPYFFSSVYHVMSPERVACQKFKATLHSHRLGDHSIYYGQFVGAEDYLARNRVMMISRPYYNAERDGVGRLDEFRRACEEHHLRVHAEEITFRVSPATLIVVMDTGVNEVAAMAFARTVDRENDQ